MPKLLHSLDTNTIKIYESLKEETIWLFGRWMIYCQLFYSDESNITLLNDCAPSFFRMMQDTYIYYIIITISRITDPPKTCNNENCTFSQLLKALKSTNHNKLYDSLNKNIKILNDEIKEIRYWRNKKLSHKDLTISINVEHLPKLHYEKIELSLKYIKGFMNNFESYFYGYPVQYDQFSMHDDGKTILNYLEELKLKL